MIQRFLPLCVCVLALATQVQGLLLYTDGTDTGAG